ncbi:hypothetical protein C1H76_4160 [Elsinoe australis]|uniref:Uncharacterized protein n=1 Tax=Elsinoe australis TaxID=40998 RepID=A0A4U7B4F5_9PEZI|nr:hypothetical protein C1H76_4160 [Elsinoe australis]
MKVSSTITILSSIALAAAQFHFNEKDSTFSCTKAQGLAAYCAGGDIIIRCSNGVGHAGNCNDNLAGERPYGNNGLAGCYQTSPSSGDAACTKAGLVYPATGAGDSRLTNPYPIPGSASKVAHTAIYKLAGTGTGIPLATGTGSANPNFNQNPTWSNTTTIVTKPIPAYTAGATLQPTTAAAAATPSASAKTQAYTGSATSQTQTSSSPYWAFALFAVAALL